MTGTPRPPFAARYKYAGWGITLIILGALCLPAIVAREDGIGVVLLGVGLIVWGIYLLRGVGAPPTAAERQAMAEAALIAQRQHDYEQAVRQLTSAKEVGRAATFIAYRDAYAMAQRWYPGAEMAIIPQILALAKVDRASLQSHHVGNIVTITGEYIEVFDDWIIWGRSGYDVDASTRGNVYVDQPSGPDNISYTAQVSIASSSWSLSTQIHQAAVYEARRILDQLSAHIETRKQRGISHEDIQSMIEVIRNSTYQSESEKIRELSKLRYEWLLSDAEFEQARQRILVGL